MIFARTEYNHMGCCGVGMLYTFKEHNDGYSATLEDVVHKGGSNYAQAGFINNARCKEAYAILNKRFKIVFQSEVRMNKNSDNAFFFVVYDTSEDKDARVLEEVKQFNKDW